MRNLKCLLLLLIACIFAAPKSIIAQEITTVILVRHAEKADDGTSDPPLNEKGKKRARDLASMLSKTEISAIYSTDYKRTRQTMMPLARQKGLEINTYDPTESAFVDSLIAQHKGGTVLISGHSNTTPEVANLLLDKNRFKPFDESDYGNIFIITLEDIGKGEVVHLRY
jgi:broad specificity phosphatase PhoE